MLEVVDFGRNSSVRLQNGNDELALGELTLAPDVTLLDLVGGSGTDVVEGDPSQDPRIRVSGFETRDPFGTDRGDAILHEVLAAIAEVLDPLVPSQVDDHGNTPSTATPVSVPSTTGGNLEVAGDNDFFRFTAVSGVTYTLSTTLGTLTDTTLTLYGTDGTTLLAFNDDSGGTLASRIEWVAPANGNYYFDVRGFLDNSAGTYTVAVVRS
ncbi:MAG TPA: pre-peptidase C-terminal domain-containing protein [Planctomycetaceae bacterium]|nr:pre-peptidase C-terminal domain-containing protein [Planctomycetaceae bacterium]